MADAWPGPAGPPQRDPPGARRRSAPAGKARGRSPLSWIIPALLIVAAVLGTALILSTSRSRPPLANVTLDSRGGPNLPPAIPAPVVQPDGSASPSTAPALSRAAREEAAAAPHPMPEQLRAAREIAETRREQEVARVAPAPPAPPAPPTPAYAPRLAPPGRVVQLGAYDSAREAEKKAQLFRARYGDLLAALPKAVLPSRAAGAKRFYYRVQFIAPNQAYAEVTCQRLRAARQSCIVLY